MTSLSHTKPTPLPRLNGTGTTPSPVLRGQEYSSSEAEEDDALMGGCADCEECARNQANASYDDHTGQRSHRSTGKSYDDHTGQRSHRSTGKSYDDHTGQRSQRSTGKRLRRPHRPALAPLHR